MLEELEQWIPWEIWSLVDPKIVMYLFGMLDLEKLSINGNLINRKFVGLSGLLMVT